jgi:acid phosphatase type 7
MWWMALCYRSDCYTDQVYRAFLGGVLALAAAACGGGNGAGPFVGPSPGEPTFAVIVGAGDIAECGPGTGAEATAALLDGIPGIVFTAGDNAYPHGTMDDFMRCYEPTWGRHRHRTRPAPGNHDYQHAGAADYFRYFGPAAGPPGLGYYSFQAGPWRVVSLNSNIDVSATSEQLRWLRAEIGTDTTCTAAIFHHPPFSSGPNGDQLYMRELWRELYMLNVDVVIAGHDHFYERFAPQDQNGRLDPARGVRLFVVGSGGARLSQAVRIRTNSDIRASAFGVLKLTLRTGAYDWEFVSVSQTARDTGTATCH